MSRPPPACETFRKRLRNREPLRGTFIKTPTCHAIEILGDAGFDFVVLDEEHAPFDRASLDVALLAAKAVDTAALVRVADVGAILPALDLGAAGVLVPHVSTRAIAESVAGACRYRGGSRGFTNGTRAGRYGALGMAQHIAAADEMVTVIGMIEDVVALDALEEIAAVPGIDGFFLGRGDLAAAMGETSMEAPAVREAVERAAAAAAQAGKTLCAMPVSTQDAKWLRRIGVTALVLSSDHGFMRTAAIQALADYKDL